MDLVEIDPGVEELQRVIRDRTSLLFYKYTDYRGKEFTHLGHTLEECRNKRDAWQMSGKN